MVDLFSPVGPEPNSIADVYARHKDISYANRSERGIRDYEDKHNLRRAVRALYKALPETQSDDPELKRLAELGCRTTMEIVHLSYGGKPWETATRDADFSSLAIGERWGQGYADGLRVIARAAWLQPVPANAGVVVYDAGTVGAARLLSSSGLVDRRSASATEPAPTWRCSARRRRTGKFSLLEVNAPFRTRTCWPA